MMAAMLLGAALPRSLWQWTLITALPILGTFSLMSLMRSANSDGSAYPTVSGMFTVVAPAAMQASSIRYR